MKRLALFSAGLAAASAIAFAIGSLVDPAETQSAAHGTARTADFTVEVAR
jgi:hypothetical protein